MPPVALRIIRTIDAFTLRTGKVFSFLIVFLMGSLAFEVFSRYLFNAPTIWAYDLTYMFYGALFMLGSAYTLLKGGHIRTDLLYRLWSPRWQGTIDAALYLFLFFPGIIFFLIAGSGYAAHSWELQETAAVSPWRPAIYPFKTVIPITAVLLLIQGVSQLLKSLYAAIHNEWPSEHEVGSEVG